MIFASGFSVRGEPIQLYSNLAVQAETGLITGTINKLLTPGVYAKYVLTEQGIIDAQEGQLVNSGVTTQIGDYALTLTRLAAQIIA